MLLQSLLHLSNCSRQVTNFFKEDVHGKSSKVSAFFMTCWFVSFIPMTNICWNKCCHALLHVCRGSTLALSINFPRGGSNSCLDFWFAIKVVTFVRAFNSFSESFCLYFSTAFAFSMRSENCQRCQVAFLSPICGHVLVAYICKGRKKGGSII